MKLTRIAALVPALAMVFALAGCGGAAEPIDVSALGQQLVDAAGFGEPMNALDGAVALGLYGAPEGTTVAAWAGTGATAEEVAVFDCGSAEAAGALVKTLEQRNDVRASQYADYDPEEVPKLENALIISGGQYVVLLVAQDQGDAAKIASDALAKAA